MLLMQSHCNFGKWVIYTKINSAVQKQHFILLLCFCWDINLIWEFLKSQLLQTRGAQVNNPFAGVK